MRETNSCSPAPLEDDCRGEDTADQKSSLPEAEEHAKDRQTHATALKPLMENREATDKNKVFLNEPHLTAYSAVLKENQQKSSSCKF